MLNVVMLSGVAPKKMAGKNTLAYIWQSIDGEDKVSMNDLRKKVQTIFTFGSASFNVHSILTNGVSIITRLLFCATDAERK